MIDRFMVGPDAPVFRIETNKDFVLDPTPVNATLGEVARAYHLAPPTHAAVVRKHSPTSTVYRVTSGGAHVMLRRVPASVQPLLERQCEVVDRTAHPSLLQPLQDASGSFVTVVEGNAWMAYVAIDGEVFSGRNASSVAAIRAGLDVLTGLRRFGRTCDPTWLDSLPTVSHVPDKWEKSLANLSDPAWRAANSAVGEALSPATERLLEANAVALQTLAGRLTSIDFGPRELVHNDLQHANVLVSPPGFQFIDLEDIGLEAPPISTAHMVFKLLRHPVYEGVKTLDETRADLAITVRALDSARAGIASRQRLFDAGAFRIVSEVHWIVDQVAYRGGLQYRYDLEKRLLNLFELAMICED